VPAEAGLAARLRPRTSADTEGEPSRLLGKLEASGAVIPVTQLMANSPNGFRPFVQMSNALMFRAELPERLRELVILMLASENRSGYERAEHERMSAAVVTGAEHETLRRGREAVDAFDGLERITLELALELYDGGAGDPVRWDTFIAQLSLNAALDLVLSVSWWGGYVPIVLRAIGLDPVDPPS